MSCLSGWRRALPSMKPDIGAADKPAASSQGHHTPKHTIHYLLCLSCCFGGTNTSCKLPFTLLYRVPATNEGLPVGWGAWWYQWQPTLTESSCGSVVTGLCNHGIELAVPMGYEQRRALSSSPPPALPDVPWNTLRGTRSVQLSWIRADAIGIIVILR